MATEMQSYTLSIVLCLKACREQHFKTWSTYSPPLTSTPSLDHTSRVWKQTTRYKSTSGCEHQCDCEYARELHHVYGSVQLLAGVTRCITNVKLCKATYSLDLGCCLSLCIVTLFACSALQCLGEVWSSPTCESRVFATR